jgi:hypothetical protein
VAFTVAQPGQNAAPSITGINPPAIFSLGAASKQFQMTVTGLGFTPDSVGQIEGANRPTDYVDASHLHVTIYGSDQVTPNSLAITVFTPAPGGGTSNVVTFIVRQLYRTLLPFIRK